MNFQALTQFSFAAGELSPKLHNRTDLKKYGSGAREVSNMITERHGGVKRRDGTVHVETLPSGVIARLVSFKRSSGVNLMIQVQPNLFCFHKQDATPLTNNGVVTKVITPWDETEIDGLRFAQTGDVVFITHPNYPPYKLSRLTETSFELKLADIKAGPFLGEKSDEDSRIQASAVNGTMTLTATKPIFKAGHVGSLWKLRWEDRSELGKWQQGSGYFADNEIESRGKAYRAVAAGFAGAIAPDHTEGSEHDGNKISTDANVEWKWLHSGYGVVKIVNYISDTQVTAELVVGEELPEDVVRTGTKYWSEAAWSEELGYPGVVTFYNDRLAFARGNEVYLSQNGDFENMAPTDEHGDLVATAALRFVLSDDQANSIRWLRQIQDVLIIGTTGSEWAMGPQSGNQPFGPDNVLAAPQSYHGSADFVQPQRINEALLFINRTNRRLYEMTAQEVTTRYESAELSILSDHLMKSGVIESVYTEAPEGVAWFLTGAGELISVTYERSQEVVGWHRHTLAGTNAFVESIASITAEDETYDEVWMVVSREVGGQTVRTIERTPKPFETGDSLLTEGVFLDSARVIEGAPTNIVRAAHLPNTKVDCLADGRVVAGLTTDEFGDVILPFTASRIIIGLPYVSRLVTLKPDTQSQVGEGMGRLITSPTIYVAFEDTNLCEYGRVEGYFDTLVFAKDGDPLDAPVPLFTGTQSITVGSNHEEDLALWFQQTQPLPMTIRAVSWDAITANR